MSSIDRRSVLRTGLLMAGGATLAACGGGGRKPAFVAPNGAEVRKAEAARRKAGGTVRNFRLTAAEGRVDLGGRTVRTWTYGERLPGSQIRVKAGEVVRARVTNRLPTGTTVHWHGLALRNDADGVPGVTQPEIKTEAEFTYEFTVPHPGTYWFHPHSGPHLDRGLYAPLIVEDPREPLPYDAEWVVVLDDWLDGVTGTPDDVLAELGRSMGMNGSDHSNMTGMDMRYQTETPTPGSSGMGGHMLMGVESELLGGDAGDVRYPHFLINGRLAEEPETFRAKPGDRIRIRFIKYESKNLYPVRSGERVRLSFVNRTTMWHPMHLHGHTFAVAPTGVRKDTAIVLPNRSLDVDFDADNPGRWMIRCHNIYHAESGMTLLGYQA